ncbi:MAG: M13 family metallopeptidase [Arenimonas sp.]|uniref:M13-type metalloendopeptidase n=1 Tax=Arenimonas sp. TaxID=1872635 RepID=UPI0025BDD7CE|nr:M13 family metallopeptidase [Arenimonas sp.]MBW8366926.1 M13 family metallopeptidase [Arenimonas sp.]
MPTRMRKLFSPLLAGLLVTLAAGPAAAQRAPAAPAACADFYSHANAGWLRQNPLPAGANSLTRWDQLNALGLSQRDQVLAATTAPAGATVSVRLADLFASAQDEAAIEAAGLTPVKPLLAIIDKIKRSKDIAPAVAALHAAGMPVLVDLQVLRDNQGNPYAQVGPAGLGLPDAGFYASADPLVQPVEARYLATVAQWLKLAGTPEAKMVEQAGWVGRMERDLAKATLAGRSFQVMNIKEAQKLGGSIDLGAILKAHGLKASQVALSTPEFFRALDTLIANTKPDQWKAYLKAQVLRDMAPNLAKGFNEPWGQLYEVTLAGQPAPTPRAVRARRVLEARVPELLDAAYTQRFLPVPRQERAQAVAAAVKTSALAAVDAAAWLSPAGKAAARQRLEGMQIQIGVNAPDNLFDSLKFSRQDLAGNTLALRRWMMPYALVRARAAWPAEQWQPLVAWLPQENRLLVTAATLQPPLLDDAGSAMDFGAFGALLAQQMSLAIQTWDGADASAWSKRATPLIAQYNAYSATGGATRVNGTRSFLQNQADLAGVELAWNALNAQGKPDAAASKAFFTGWAGLWARQDKDTALAAAQATANHAPGKWRVNGPLSNLPAFADAYSCKGKVAMQRPAKDQVALWR